MDFVKEQKPKIFDWQIINVFFQGTAVQMLSQIISPCVVMTLAEKYNEEKHVSYKCNRKFT